VYFFCLIGEIEAAKGRFGAVCFDLLDKLGVYLGKLVVLTLLRSLAAQPSGFPLYRPLGR